MKYVLVPINGKGCKWYTNEIKATGYIKAVSKDGYETIVNIELYKVIK